MRDIRQIVDDVAAAWGGDAMDADPKEFACEVGARVLAESVLDRCERPVMGADGLPIGSFYQ